MRNPIPTGALIVLLTLPSAPHNGTTIALPVPPASHQWDDRATRTGTDELHVISSIFTPDVTTLSGEQGQTVEQPGLIVKITCDDCSHTEQFFLPPRANGNPPTDHGIRVTARELGWTFHTTPSRNFHTRCARCS